MEKKGEEGSVVKLCVYCCKKWGREGRPIKLGREHGLKRTKAMEGGNREGEWTKNGEKK